MSEESIKTFFCQYHHCSDSNDNQYPECSIAFGLGCPQKADSAQKIMALVGPDLKALEQRNGVLDAVIRKTLGWCATGSFVDGDKRHLGDILREAINEVD